MSSPKRAAKAAKPAAIAKPAAKAAMKSGPASAAKPVLSSANSASVEAKRLAAVLERGIVDGKLDVVSAEALQVLMAAACRIYSARSEAGEQFAPIPKNSISATDIMVTASGLLRAADLAAFELGMWQSWTGR